MIKENTIFVLGAGASVPYGYPCGRKLCERICNNLRKKGTPQFEQLLTYEFSEEKIINFRSALSRSGGLSIDIFLQNNRKTFLEIGKIAIAQELISYEVEENFLVYEEKNWYRYLFDHLIKNCDNHNDFLRNEITFITFNYDRLLEHFLFTSLLHQYEDAGEEDVARIVNKIPIVHIYGRLDYLPWQRDAKDGGRYYNPTIDKAILRKSAGELNFPYEGIRKGLSNNEIGKMFEKAKFIYFFGFAYDEDNLNALNIPSAQKRGLHPIYGSAYEIGLAKRNMVEKYFKERLMNSITLGDSEEDAIKFFKKVLG